MWLLESVTRLQECGACCRRIGSEDIFSLLQFWGGSASNSIVKTENNIGSIVIKPSQLQQSSICWERLISMNYEKKDRTVAHLVACR